MKKLNILFVMLFVVLVGCCKRHNTPVENSEVVIKDPLYSIQVKSTWTEDKVQEFTKEIKKLEQKQDKDLYDIIDLARFYGYVWYPWRWVLLYENYAKTKPLWYAEYNNLWKLYESICKVDEIVNEKYCKEAIKNYYVMINTYNTMSHYKDIVFVLLKMWNKEKAQSVYDLYLKNGGKKESWIEKKLK